MSSRRGGNSSYASGDSRTKKSRGEGETAFLPPFDTTLISTCYLLESQIVLEDVRLSVDLSSCIVISSSEVPTPSNDANGNKFKSLFRKCLGKTKKDRLHFCSACYLKASKDPSDRRWCPTTWNSLARVARETSVEMMLNFVIEDSESESDGRLMDLMSSLYGRHAAAGISSNPALVNFVERLSNWSKEEVHIPSPMAQQVLALARGSPLASAAITKMVMSGGQAVSAIVKIDTVMMDGRQILGGLDTLFNDANVVEILSQAMLLEMEQVENGESFMTKSIFSALLSMTTMGDIRSMSPKDPRYSCFVELQNFPGVSSSDALSCYAHLQDAYHHIHKMVYSVVMKVIKSDKGTRTKDIVLSWLAAVVSLNEIRAGPRFRKEKKLEACSDGFMINFCAVLLAMCKPVFSTHTGGPKLVLISRDYPSSPVCRLDMVNETCLASGSITRNRTSEGNVRFRGQPCPGGSGPPAITRFKFVTEIFFITQRALHVGLIPAMNAYSSMVSDLAKELQGGNTDERIKILFTLYQLAWSSCLLDPQFVQHCCEFYITQAVWITKQLEDCRQEGGTEEEVSRRQQGVLAGLPEFCVKDMASWFRFVAVHRPALLQGLQLTPMVDCCVGLLERPDLLPHPLAQSRIVSTLLVFLNSDKRIQGHHSQSLLGSASWSGFLGELSIMVQGNPSVREHLGPALLHTYVAVAVFEGLDVDKEEFDKFSTRFEVAQLLQRLWSRPDCRESILRECGTSKFQSFLGAVLDTLLYQLNDALSRLVNVRQCETAKDNGQWDRLPSTERTQKENFLNQQKRASRGFMTQANLQLDLLLVMSEASSVARCLSLMPLARRTAAAFLGFLNTLCGSKASNLKVKDREKYAFDPVKLVSSICTILTRVYEQDGKASETGESFATCMAAHPDFSENTMNKCLTVLQKNTSDLFLCSSFEEFLKQVNQFYGLPTSPRSLDGQESLNTSDSSWQEEADSSNIDENNFREVYVAALEDAKFDGAELEGTHVLANKAQVTLDPRSPMVKAVLRDMKQLQEAVLIHPDSSVFVRQDEDHLDLVRVLITGPTGTPYSRGCFVFDINYPASYPNNPPLVIITTTAGGTIRFNPNLYADGKVCLSLLGTWHGGDASEKWDPAHSNLSQVILSIQGMILIPDPTFNEPGYEAIRGTEEGNKQSREYNADIQLYTIRYAMTEQLRNPPEGLKDVIQVHFTLQRDAVLKQCSQWLKEAISEEYRQKLMKAIDELRLELDRV